MIVETKIVGRRTPFERRPYEVPEGPHTLGSLLTRLVEAEVGRYRESQEAVGVLRVLTERDLTHGAAQGRVAVAPQERAGTVETDEAVRVALRAFSDGLYYVFVDDEQVTELERPVALRPDSTVLLLRLTALAGG
ncbi:hypothetical protein V3W47_09170 [Deinococcus sp. YIM 134068]|uniref:hypothetical protein n=1 Tax=Deinococcus lichenicola TaxID=3118910 RepID=UPI002F92CA23